MKVRRSTVIKFILLVVIAVVFIVEMIWDHEFMNNSNNLTMIIQPWGGDWLRWAGEFLSNPMVFWIVLFLHGYVVFNKDIYYMLYTQTLFFVPLTVCYTLKAIYYQGRPFAINEKIFGCECDPGMPSGHATTSTMVYFILYDIIKRNFIDQNAPGHRCWEFLWAIMCGIIAGLIMASRITLGNHSYAQIVLGLLIGLFFATFLTFQSWSWIVFKIRKHIRVIAVIHLLVSLVFAMVMLWINQTYRNDLNYWKYFDKCPTCRRSFVFGQSQTLAATVFLPTLYFFFPFTSRYRAIQQLQSLNVNWAPKPPQASMVKRDRQFTNSQYAKRYIILLLITLPAIIFGLAYKFGIEKPMRNNSDNVVLQSIINFCVIATLCIYTAWAMTWLKTKVYHKYNLLNANDFLDLEQLPILVPDEDDAVDVNLLEDVAPDFEAHHPGNK